MLVPIILVTALIAIFFYYLSIKSLNYWKDRGVVQEKPTSILWKNWRILFNGYDFSDLIQIVYYQFPGARYLGFYEFLQPTLIVKDPDLIKQITVKDFEHFTDHISVLPEDSDPLWSNNLFALKGQKWREMRTILSPSFTSSKMRAMFVLMEECAENFVRYFLKKDENIITNEMKDCFTRYTADVIGTTAFGVQVNSLENPENEFYLMGKKVANFSGLGTTLKMIGYLLFPKLFSALKIKLVTDEERNFFMNLVEGTIKKREEQGIVRPDMINLLMEARKGHSKYDRNGTGDSELPTVKDFDQVREKVSHDITNEDIASQAMIFFFAGFDSVSTLMCFTSYELALNPDIQEKLRKEVRTTFEDCGGKLTYEGLTKMKYMDMVVSEVLRKWPSFLATDRVCTKPYTIEPVAPNEKPLHLDKGSMIWLPTFNMHHDPKHFPDPERFDPERFSEENKENVKPYTYFPFGLGPRNCIASRFALLETKVIYFHILLHFQIIPVEKTQIPLKWSSKSFILQAEDGIWLGLKRIKE